MADVQAAYDENVQAARCEAAALRSTVKLLQNGLSKMLATIGGTTVAVSDERLELPHELVQDELHKDVMDALEQLASYVTSAAGGNRSTVDEGVLLEAQAKIEEQQKVLTAKTERVTDLEHMNRLLLDVAHKKITEPGQLNSAAESIKARSDQLVRIVLFDSAEEAPPINGLRLRAGSTRGSSAGGGAGGGA
eukprot:SAG31_NODE_8191_length_1500_cov_1.581727_1_plen_192_part_00